MAENKTADDDIAEHIDIKPGQLVFSMGQGTVTQRKKVNFVNKMKDGSTGDGEKFKFMKLPSGKYSFSGASMDKVNVMHTDYIENIVIVTGSATRPTTITYETGTPPDGKKRPPPPPLPQPDVKKRSPSRDDAEMEDTDKKDDRVRNAISQYYRSGAAARDQALCDADRRARDRKEGTWEETERRAKEKAKKHRLLLHRLLSQM